MMPSAAPQHASSSSVRLEGVPLQLSRILPPAAIHQLRPVRARLREEAGSLNMNTTTLVAVRAYSALKGTLALVGVAAIAAWFVLPAQRESFDVSATTSAGLIQTGGVDSAREREQRAVIEYIAR